MKILHILNGDSLVPEFQRSGLRGEIFVWRESLAEGPAGSFSELPYSLEGRKEYWKEATGDPSEGQKWEKKFLKPLLELNLKAFVEINLWFEFDWFCQINMIAALSFLHSRFFKLKLPAIYLICPGEMPGHEDFRGLGQLSGQELSGLYPDRIKVGARELIFASDLWENWTRGRFWELSAAIRATATENFPHLQRAFEAHTARYPSRINGISAVEQEFYDLCDGEKNLGTLVRHFLKQEKWMGFGDLFYQNIIRRRPHLFSSFNPPKLNTNGIKVRQNERFDNWHFFNQIQYETLPGGFPISGIEKGGGNEKFITYFRDPKTGRIISGRTFPGETLSDLPLGLFPE